MKKSTALLGMILFALLLFIGCNSSETNNKSKENESTEAVEIVVEEIIDEDKEFERIINQFETLFNELMSIKDEPEFKIYGFGDGGNYNNWMKKVDDLENDKYSKLLLRKQIAAGDLKTLAIEYAGTEGKENEFTRTMTNIITQAFQPEIIIEEVQVVSDVDDQLYGEWSIESIFLSELNHRCKIYFNGVDYYSIITYRDNSTNKEVLKKEGNRFYIVGNQSGEFYLINPTDKKMTLHDRQGVLDMFSAKLIN